VLAGRRKHGFAKSNVLSTEGIVDSVERVHCSVCPLNRSNCIRDDGSATAALNRARATPADMDEFSLRRDLWISVPNEIHDLQSQRVACNAGMRFQEYWLMKISFISAPLSQWCCTNNKFCFTEGQLELHAIPDKGGPFP
jgi:hypothetical protein